MNKGRLSLDHAAFSSRPRTLCVRGYRSPLLHVLQKCLLEERQLRLTAAVVSMDLEGGGESEHLPVDPDSL